MRASGRSQQTHTHTHTHTRTLALKQGPGPKNPSLFIKMQVHSTRDGGELSPAVVFVRDFGLRLFHSRKARLGRVGSQWVGLRDVVAEIPAAIPDESVSGLLPGKRPLKWHPLEPESCLMPKP